MYKKKAALLWDMSKKYSLLKEAVSRDSIENLSAGLMEISSAAEITDTINFDISSASADLSRIIGADISAVNEICDLDKEPSYRSWLIARENAEAALKKAAAECDRLLEELSLQANNAKNEAEELKRTEAMQRYLDSINRKFF